MSVTSTDNLRGPRCVDDRADRPTYVLPPGEIDEQARGITVSGYHVLDCLGQGGMGAVYRARDLALQRLVAIKVLLRIWSSVTSRYSGRP